MDYEKYRKQMQIIRNPQNFTNAIGQSNKNHELYSETLVYGYGASFFVSSIYQKLSSENKTIFFQNFSDLQKMHFV